jgi:hypothetical protein
MSFPLARGVLLLGLFRASVFRLADRKSIEGSDR